MGLIQAGLSAVSSVLADQWKEYFYCEALPNNVLAVKGKKKTYRIYIKEVLYKGDMCLSITDKNNKNRRAVIKTYKAIHH